MWGKPRLGKRSPLGELLSAAYPAGGAPTAKVPAEADTAWATRARKPCSGRVNGRPVLTHDEGGGGREGFEPAAVVSVQLPSMRLTSASISVPGRRGQGRKREVEVDELMAAMVLSSLSGSPVLHRPAHVDNFVPPIGCRGSKLSEGGAVSGYWKGGHGSESPATPPDECLDFECGWVPFDVPTTVKRGNSGYRCLWPGCDKVLTTIVRIRRHIRNTHLTSDHQRNEEDFYYTEASQWESPPSPPLGLPFSPACLSAYPSAPPPSPVLSRSAPSVLNTSWQVQSEHSYQQGHAPAARAILVDQWFQRHSTPAPCRRLRSEAKKCRRVYGIEQREQWCTSCRWKKACQRFLS